VVVDVTLTTDYLHTLSWAKEIKGEPVMVVGFHDGIDSVEVLYPTFVGWIRNEK
jgi:hypothetical protein